MPPPPRAPIVAAHAIRHRDTWLLTVECPYCGRTHQHGGGGDAQPSYGHRVQHCSDSDTRRLPGYVLAPEAAPVDWHAERTHARALVTATDDDPADGDTTGDLLAALIGHYEAGTKTSRNAALLGAWKARKDYPKWK